MSMGALANYQGDAIPAYEASAAAKLQGIFWAAAPGMSGITGWLRYLRLVDIQVVVRTSPPSALDVTRTEPFITIGSPAYNGASERIETEFPVGGRFAAGGLEVEGYQSVIVGGEFSMLVRATDPTTHQVGFYAAGTSVGGSAGAANHLLANWRNLAKHHRQRDFALLLRVNEDGSTQEVIYETSGPEPTVPEAEGRH